MKTVVGIFSSHLEAEQAVQGLQSHGISNKNINVLVPGASQQEIDSVPTTESEQPGMGKAVGGVVGAAAGVTGGLQLGAVASLLVPGIGSVIAVGVAAGALLGVGGAVGGAKAGEALEDKLTQGLPKDEMFVYEDALRQGRTVVVVFSEDEAEMDVIRGDFVRAGAENLDSARKKWWLGLRDVEKEHYDSDEGDFATDEPTYQQGFEAALALRRRGKSFPELQSDLQEYYPEVYTEKAFRRGFERGQAYYQGLVSRQDDE